MDRLLKRIPLFAHVSGGAREVIVECLRLRRTQPGEDIVSRGERGDSLYFVVEGEFEVSLPGGAIRTLRQGDFFGEIGLLLAKERTATVSSKGEGLLLELSREDFARVERVLPGLRGELEEVARRRLQDRL